MKKFLAGILLAAMLLSACAGGKAPDQTKEPGATEQKQASIENINIFFDIMEEKAAMWEVLVTLKDVTLTSSFDNNWEIGGATTSKGAAVEALCEKLEIQKGHVMACGDSPNDESMLRMAGVPVAVGNAKDVIKGLAVFVSGTNEEDGVAMAIEKFVLQGE